LKQEKEDLIMEKNPGYFLLPESVEYIPNVEYATGAGMPLKLDILRPDPMPKNKVPVMIYIHGGGWLGGSYQLLPNLLYILWQSDYKVPVNVLLAANGFFTVTIQYRKSFEAIFPAQIEDCKAAVRWVRAHAEEYNLDTEHIGVWGHSAGGHLAALLGTSADVEELEGNGGWGEYSSRVHAVVDCFGPTDFKQFRKGMDDPRKS
jgi:acetyl esterase/lipase